MPTWVRSIRPPRRLANRRGAVTALIVLGALTVAGLAQVRIDTGIASFLPTGDPAYHAIEDKAKAFGGDPIVVLLESTRPRNLIGDPDNLARMVRLEGKLSNLPDVSVVYGPGTILNQTAGSAQDVLAQISGARDASRNKASAAAKAKGANKAGQTAAGNAEVAKFDRRYGSLMVQGMPAGLPTLKNSKFVQTVLYGEDGDPRPQWRSVVPDNNTVAVLVRPREDLDQAAAGHLVKSVRQTVAESGLKTEKTTVTGVPAITSGLTDRARSELPILGAISLVAVSLVFFLVPWTKRRRSRLRPPLAAVLGTAVTLSLFGWIHHPVSLGVVAFLPILLGIGSDFPFYLSQPRHPRRILTAALAGAVGFGSLTLSPLPFVRELGIALFLGILITVGIALVTRRVLSPVEPAEEESAVDVRPPFRLSAWRKVAAGTIAVALAVAGWAALPGLQVEAQPDKLARGLPELKDATHAEQVLGSNGEVNIVLKGKNVVSPAALKWTRDAQTTVVRKYGDDFHAIISASDLLRFLGAKPTQNQIDAAMGLAPTYLTSSVITPNQTQSVMVFGVQLDDVKKMGVLLDHVRSSLPPPPAGMTVGVVGLPVAAVHGLDLVSGGRVLINLAGIAAAGLVLLIGLRRKRDAFLAVATVLISTGWVFGLASITAGSLNPLTVAIGSLTTATACEFSVMLGRSGGRLAPWRSVGTAALAGTVGYLVLALSGLAVLRDFGLLLGASVGLSFLAALVTALVMAPRHRRVAEEVVPVKSAEKRQEVSV